MKALMEAIKTHLQDDSTLGYVRDTDIYITEDVALIPAATRFPAIAIKDGAIRNEQKLTKNYIQYAQVEITAYQRIVKPEESIMGTHGVLSMASDIITSLIDDRLGFDSGSGQVINVFPVSEGASELFGDESEMIQRKTITMMYTRHKTWS